MNAAGGRSAGQPLVYSEIFAVTGKSVPSKGRFSQSDKCN
jgi:hypothetical protein